MSLRWFGSVPFWYDLYLTLNFTTGNQHNKIEKIKQPFGKLNKQSQKVYNFGPCMNRTNQTGWKLFLNVNYGIIRMLM